MKSKSIQLASIIALAAASAPSAEAATIFVKADAVGANNGTSWANAFNTLQPAITAAGSGDQVWVAAGTYKPATPATPNPRSLSFTLKSNVQVLGGFAGTETLAWQRNGRTNVCVLSGDINGDDTPNFGNRADNSFHVVAANGVAFSSVLDGFVIRGGQADGAFPDNNAAALRFTTSSVRVRNCIIRDNFALRAAVQCLSSPAEFTNDVITGNRGNSAAALDVQNGTAPNMVNCTIVANTSLGTNNVLYLNCTGGLLSGCVFWGNVANNPSLQLAQFEATNAPTLSVTNNDIQGGTAGLGASNFTADPLLISMLGSDAIAGSGDEDLRLRPGSPCIDLESPIIMPSDVTDMDGDGDLTEDLPLDLAWRDRVHNDPATSNPGTQTLDIGAYDFQGTSCLGDMNGDGVINTSDLTRFLAVFGDSGEPLRTGDFNADGLVNTADLTLLLSHFGAVCPS